MSDHQATLSEKNQNFFDSLATSPTRPQWVKDLVSQIQSEILARRDRLGIPTPTPSPHLRLLDYACGSGELSHTLLPYLSSVRGIDISPAMISAFNSSARTADIPTERMHAVQGDILSSPADEQFSDEEWFSFDIATISMALHHVASPSNAIKKLVARLKEGGGLVAVDWKVDDAAGPEGQGRSHHTHHHGHGHHNPSAQNVVPGSEGTITRDGFTEKEMHDMLLAAGCEESSIGFVEFPERTRVGDGEDAGMKTLFLAKGRKAVQE